ncbi:MAG: hypothetical protein ACE5JF_05100 [Anaerolineales bacterium]
MNISLGMVEWEENRRSAPGTLGRKLAVALSVLTLSALALGNWLAPTDLSSVEGSSSTVAEVAFAVDPEPAQAQSSEPAGSQVFAK